jgi:hypothetical protein
MKATHALSSMSGSGSASGTRSVGSNPSAAPKLGMGRCLLTGRHPRLLVSAFENADLHSVQSYMNRVRRDPYSGYDLKYARRWQTWFVLSGENDQNVFYEKVMFSCSGRFISSLALNYPIARNATFDRFVERIEKTFRPAQNCGQYARQP